MRITAMPECPFCKEKIGANDLLSSAEAACPVCGHRLVAPASPEPWWVAAAPPAPLETKTLSAEPSPEPWWLAPAAPEPKRPVVTQLAPTEVVVSPQPSKEETAPPAAAPPPPPSPPALAAGPPRHPPRSVPADDEEPSSLVDRLRNLDFGSALAFVCFSGALLFCSFERLELFIKPMAALGVLAGLGGGVWTALRRKRAILPFLLSILCLLVLLFGGSWPASPTPPPPLVMVPLKPDGMAVHQAASEDDWVDASANAVKREEVRVEIVSVQIGPVDLKRKSTASPSPERYLVIRVRVSYEGVVFQQTPYEPWADRADAPSKHSPTLTDDQGRDYVQKTFGPGWKVAGRADVDALNPGHQVKEVLVYPVPAKDAVYLRLMLPASAFGLTGAFRFQIPRSMIRGL